MHAKNSFKYENASNIKVANDAIVKATSFKYLDDIRDKLFEFHSNGLKSALITLVNVEGSSPWPVGTQMVVSENGESAGLISGGCIEAEVLLEAKQCLFYNQWKLIRYGKDSDYMDLKLPCGSGIDILIVPIENENWVVQLKQATVQRFSISMVFNTRREVCNIDILTCPSNQKIKESGSSKRQLTRLELASHYHHEIRYIPKHRLVVLGQGHIYNFFCSLVQGFDLEVISLGSRYDSKSIANIGLDRFSSAVLLDHDHEHDIPIICELLKTPISYIGALGSTRTHKNRLDLLRSEGVLQNDLNRIKGPAGLDIGGKNPQEIALSILSEIIAHKNNI